MKKIAALVGGLVSALGVAQNAALVTKVNGSGHVPPEYNRNERCEVFADRVVITKRLGSLVVTEQKTQTIAGDVQKLLTAAAAENVVKKDNFLCDAPGTTVSAGETLLFTSGGCGSPRQERHGVASRVLRELVDHHCPKTNDHGAN